jgi:hypothetical protein
VFVLCYAATVIAITCYSASYIAALSVHMHANDNHCSLIFIDAFTAHDASQTGGSAAAAAEVREVRGQRYNPSTGETETVVGASKGQKRKHQINSLAAQAASMELELMDKRGSGFLTKAQTQAKYGW